MIRWKQSVGYGLGLVGLSLFALGGCSRFKSHIDKTLLVEENLAAPSWYETRTLPLATFMRDPMDTDCKNQGVCAQPALNVLRVVPVGPGRFWVVVLQSNSIRLWRVDGSSVFSSDFLDTTWPSQGMAAYAPSMDEVWLMENKAQIHKITLHAHKRYTLPQGHQYENQSNWYSLCGNAADDLWAIFPDSERYVAHYDGSAWALLEKFGQLATPRVTSISCLTPDDVWWSYSTVWNEAGTLIRFDHGWLDAAANRIVLQAVGHAGNAVWGIEKRADDNKALVYFDGNQITDQDFPAQFGNPSSLWMDEQDRLWVGTDQGVFRKSGDTWETIFSKSIAGGLRVFGSGSNDVWIQSISSLSLLWRLKPPA